MPTENETPEIETFNIPAANMGRLQTKFDKMNRKAAQIGCPPVSFEVLREYEIVHPDHKDPDRILPESWLPKIKMVEFVVHGDGPKIEGWKFVGTLDLNTLPGSTIVKTVPDQKVPQEYYEHDGSCDHCNRIRRRNETFVLEGQDENEGQHQVVGRNCLRDFFGHDPSQIARFLSSLNRFLNDMEDEERGFGGFGGPSDYVYDHKTVLAATAAVINLEGWRAKSACLDSMDTPTASLVLDIFLPVPRGMPEREKRERLAWIEKLDYLNERFTTEAVGAMEWLEEQDANNDYMHNLHTIAAADAVPAKMFGFWCSLMAPYHRAQERLALQKAERDEMLNEFLDDAIKARVEAEVTLVAIRSFDGAYGTVHIHRMVDSDGRTLIWFANARPTMEQGKKYRIAGTVKKKDEYKGWKQTHVNRVRVLNEIEEA